MIGILSEKKEVATGTLQVTFEIKESFNFKPGQYIFLTLDLKHTDERGERRHFSINNSPNEKGIITITTRLSDSGFKKTLNELQVGDAVELGPIAGAFVLPENKSKPLVFTGEARKLVFIAGGIGITPFMSMLRYLKEEGNPYNITLIYSNRNQASTAFLEEVKNLGLKIKDMKLILSMTEDDEWGGEKRRIDADFIKEYFPNVNKNYYMVVGPPAMTEAVQKSLMDAGVEIDNIKVEKFTGY